MKYYKDLAELGVFTSEEAAEVMGSRINAPKNLNLMIKGGSIRRIKRNLYTCINLATGEDLADRFLIGSKITEGAFLSFHSAFEYYGFYNQMFYEIQVASAQRFVPFEDNGYKYKCFATASDAQVETVRGVKTATIERTIIDSINMLGRVMDAEELVKCLQLIHLVREKRLVEMLRIYDKDILYRKAGYVLSCFKEQLHISDSFFEFCKTHSNPKNVGKLSSMEIGPLEFISEWGIYGYKNLTDIVNKGGEADV